MNYYNSSFVTDNVDLGTIYEKGHWWLLHQSPPEMAIAEIKDLSCQWEENDPGEAKVVYASYLDFILCWQYI